MKAECRDQLILTAMAAHDSRNPAGVLRSLLHPPSTEADRVKATEDRVGPERTLPSFMKMNNERRSEVAR